jgi:hypothetical protein
MPHAEATVDTMTALTVHAHGRAPVALAWERYADPALWATWAPQIQRVETAMDRLSAGSTGVVHAGPLSRPTIPVRFTVLEVDEVAREWSWRARFGPITLRLEHGVAAHLTGSSTWLRIHGPLPVVLGYAPVARLALAGLVMA